MRQHNKTHHAQTQNISFICLCFLLLPQKHKIVCSFTSSVFFCYFKHFTLLNMNSPRKIKLMYEREGKKWVINWRNIKRLNCIEELNWCGYQKVQKFEVVPLYFHSQEPSLTFVDDFSIEMQLLVLLAWNSTDIPEVLCLKLSSKSPAPLQFDQTSLKL